MSLTPAEEAQLVSRGGGLTPVSTVAGIPPIAAQTFDRRFAISTAVAPTSALLVCTGIWLPQGQVVSAITFMSGAQAEGTGTQLWFALYRSDTSTLMAQAASNTASAAFGASLSFRMALTSPQTCPYSGLYWLGFCCVASGTVPTLLCLTSGVITNNGAVASTAPFVSFSADSGLVGTAPATLGAKTAIVQSYWAGID